MSLNKVILIGNLGADPETKHFTDGQVTNISLATSETFKNKNGDKVTNTEWHRLVLYSKHSEIAEKYLSKGSLICVEGKIKTRSYEQNGEKRYITEIIVYNLQMLGSYKKDDDESDQTPADFEKQQNEDETDDLPF